MFTFSVRNQLILIISGTNISTSTIKHYNYETQPKPLFYVAVRLPDHHVTTVYFALGL